jgi:tRNA-specific 2-thiouridylase
VDLTRFEEHLRDPARRGAIAGAASGEAGGAPCGDVVRVSLALAAGTITAARFEASGCGAATAAGSATTALVEGRPLLDAALLDADAVSAELGGLSPGKRHAAALAADALHRAISAAVAKDHAVADGASDRVLVAMSGGVDSAVAALLERRSGREVIAVTLKLWADRMTDGGRSCCSPEAVIGARSLSQSLGIPHVTLDLEREFRTEVVGAFVRGYAEGRTPNPCVRCNGTVRIAAMLDLAERLGAGALATGHYARIGGDGEGPLLALAADSGKDQSYMLAGLEPEALARLRFPLAELTKPEVRQIAAEAGLPVASKAESQDLCFLAGDRKEDFLRRHAGLGERPGYVVDRKGQVLGRHRGQHRYTVGQRRGLGIAAERPLYVLDKDARRNRVVVGSRSELALSRVPLERPVLHRAAERVNRAKLRYRSAPVPCSLRTTRAGASLELSRAVEGIAPGQIACLMDGDLIVGWATIGRPAT